MSEEKKPREFWIAWDDKFNPDRPLGRVPNVLRMVCNYSFTPSIHVIEKSAYDHALKRIERLRTALEEIRDAMPNEDVKDFGIRYKGMADFLREEAWFVLKQDEEAR